MTSKKIWRLIMQLALVAGLSACSGRGNEEEKLRSANDEEVGTNPLNAPAEYLGAVGQAKRFSEAQSAIASLGQAIKMFEIEFDRLPASLQELVDEGQLSVLPKAPFQMAFRYDSKTGKVTAEPVPQP